MAAMTLKKLKEQYSNMVNGITDENNSTTEDLQEEIVNETVVSAEVNTKPKKHMLVNIMIKVIPNLHGRLSWLKSTSATSRRSSLERYS